MTAQIRAELLKIRSTRTTVALILGMLALILLFTLLTGLLSHPSGLASRQDQRQLLSLSSIAGVFSALAGVLLVTSEYRYGTIRPTLLFNPARSHVLTAKVLVGMFAGLAFGILSEAIGWAIGYAILDARGITIVLTNSDVLLLTLGGLAVVALWGAIGAGLGAIIHNQVGAIITLRPGASSSTTSSSASFPPSDGSCPRTRLTHSWASEPTTCSHQPPAPAP
jgi:ABC-2 type transport system permease protein